MTCSARDGREVAAGRQKPESQGCKFCPASCDMQHPVRDRGVHLPMCSERPHGTNYVVDLRGQWWFQLISGFYTEGWFKVNASIKTWVKSQFP